MAVRGSQTSFAFQTRGGKRKGAGRKRKAPRAMTPHRKRPIHKDRHPVLVTIRIADDILSLRHRDRELVIREAMITTAKRDNFHLIYYSIQHNHLHQLVEAADTVALSRGMQGFQISMAKRLNRALGRKGQVFIGRYHAVELTTPRHVRNAINYLFNNWRKHGADRRNSAKYDPFSNALGFHGWAGTRAYLWKHELPDVWLPTWHPKTWLLREGWRRDGPLSPWDRPG